MVVIFGHFAEMKEARITRAGPGSKIGDTCDKSLSRLAMVHGRHEGAVGQPDRRTLVRRFQRRASPEHEF